MKRDELGETVRLGNVGFFKNNFKQTIEIASDRIRFGKAIELSYPILSYLATPFDAAWDYNKLCNAEPN